MITKDREGLLDESKLEKTSSGLVLKIERVLVSQSLNLGLILTSIETLRERIVDNSL